MSSITTARAESPLRRAGLLGPVLGAVAAVVVVFVLFELAERLWLREYGPEFTYWAHFARGLISSFAAALIVGLLVYRASASLYAADLSTRDWIQGTRPVPEERNRYYALWLIQLRWIAVVVAAGLVLFASASDRLPPETRWPIVLTLAALAVVNAGYTVLTRHPELNRWLLPVQSYSDLLFLAVLLHYSGGIENPLWIALVFHVAISGIVLDRRHCYAVAAVAAALFALVAGAEAVGVLDHHYLSVMPHAQQQNGLLHAGEADDYVMTMIVIVTGTLFLVAFFVTTLGDRIRQDEHQLSALADRALTERQLLEQALITTRTGLCVFDTALHPLWKNKQWESWFPEVPEGTIQKMLNETGNQVEEVVVGRSSDGAEQSGGSETVVQLTTGSVDDGEGRVDRIFVLAQDVTAQKQVQANMIRAEKLAALGELAGHVAHEVNNPIGIITAKSRLLLSNRRSEISNRVAEELVKITDLADRVADIAGRLLSYCRQSPSSRSPIDVTIPIREAMALLGERARKKGVTFNERLDTPIPKLRANAKEMQQVMVNLLLNALDATTEDGRITVGAYPDPPGWVRVFVEDNGVGIPPELRKSIFEPFVTTKPDGSGTGLGLSVCDGLIRSHGGRIEVDSEVDRGTRVTVVLPVDDGEGEDT